MNPTVHIEKLSYRGKHYLIPHFSPDDPLRLSANPLDLDTQAKITAQRQQSPSMARTLDSIHQIWDLAQFQQPHQPVSVGLLDTKELSIFTQPFEKSGGARVLDMPIKFPDNPEYRIPRALAQFAGAIQKIIDFEHHVNPHHADYFAYLTIDQRIVQAGTLHREAPCHVDGFQGARWNPKCYNNHSYTVSDVLPTAYYVQPFDFTGLDESKHDFFWEMNAQVADTNEAYKWQSQAAEITIMDCYCVHRGVPTDVPVMRTWLRLSFEERRRIFDRLGNGHNPLFAYAWEMQERDIEQLHLTAYRTDSDPSLRVFPWQDTDGKPLPAGAQKTSPKLRRDP